MKLKLCGIRNKAMVTFCQDQKVDFVGFNFISTSKRRISPNFIHQIPKNFYPQKVALFRDQSLSEIEAIIKQFPVEIIQLHGQESPDFCQSVKTIFSNQIKVFKAFCLTSAFDINHLKNYQGKTDLWLFDGAIPGQGKAINEDSAKVLQQVIAFSEKQNIPYAIAGGINIHNIQAFKSRYAQAAFLDLASGIEKDGKFDRLTAQRLVKIVHQQ